MIKYCRRCEENTERHAVNKRCLKCKAKLDAEAWTRKKEAMKADPEKLKAYRAAGRERMKAYTQRQKEAYQAMTPAERYAFDNEKEAARRVRQRYL